MCKSLFIFSKLCHCNFISCLPPSIDNTLSWYLPCLLILVRPSVIIGIKGPILVSFVVLLLIIILALIDCKEIGMMVLLFLRFFINFLSYKFFIYCNSTHWTSWWPFPFLLFNYPMLETISVESMSLLIFKAWSNWYLASIDKVN